MGASIWQAGAAEVSVNANFTLKSQEFVATAAQSLFNLTAFEYVLGTGSLLVFKNGEIIRFSDFDETSVNSFTLDAAAALNDKIVALGFVGITGTIGSLSGAIWSQNSTYLAGTIGARLKNSVSVKDPPFLATGDGVTDDTAAIIAADIVAAARGATLYFPGGIYMISGVNSTSPVADAAIQLTCIGVWANGDATIRRKDFTRVAASYHILADRINNLYISGITFDGQVTTVVAGATPNVDLGAAGAYADDGTETKWTQCFGVRVYGGKSGIVQNCHFNNFLRAGLRIDSDGEYPNDIASGHKVLNCKTNRTRGINGDGFYFAANNGIFAANLEVYDYQRIAICEEVANAGGGVNDAMNYDNTFVNIITDFGHDSVAPQNNASHWSESSDGTIIHGHIAKNTSIAGVFGASLSNDVGVSRSNAATYTVHGFNAINVQSGLEFDWGGTRGVVSNCTDCNIQTRRFIAGTTTAFNSRGAPAGIKVLYAEDANKFSVRSKFTNCHVESIDYGDAAAVQYAAYSVPRGKVTDYRQLKLSYRDCSMAWFKTDGTRDTRIQAKYESIAAPNYGYFGGFITSGLNDQNTDQRFNGEIIIDHMTDETFDYVMIGSELVSSSRKAMVIKDTVCSLRTGGVTSNVGHLILVDSEVDFRGDIHFDSIKMRGGRFMDHNTASKSRVALTTFFSDIKDVDINRTWLQATGGGNATHHTVFASVIGCRIKMGFGLEPAFKFSQGANLNAQWTNSGNIYENDATTAMGADDAMIHYDVALTANSKIYMNGTGNVYDINVSHMVLLDNAAGPIVNDDPATIAYPFNELNGVKKQMNPV